MLNAAFALFLHIFRQNNKLRKKLYPIRRNKVCLLRYLCYNISMSNYFDDREILYTEKTRQICEDLPPYVMEFLVGIQMRTTPLTRYAYAGDLKIFLEFLFNNRFKGKYQTLKEITLEDIEQLTAFDIELFLEYLSLYKINGRKIKCGERAKERKLSAIRSFYKFFYKHDLLSTNVTQKVDTPKIHDKPIVFLDKHEISKLIEEAKDGDSLSSREKTYHNYTKCRDVALLSLLLGTGMRISECVGINEKDLDLKNNAVSITRKGGNKTILYFSEDVASALIDYLNWKEDQITQQTDFAKNIKDTDALFLSLQGRRINVRTAENLVKKYASYAAPLKKISPHKLRSTFGTTLYRKTKDIYVVADILGHRDVNTTKKHYAAISEDIRKSSANLIKFDENDDD